MLQCIYYDGSGWTSYYGVSYDAGILGIISYVPFYSVILLLACENETVVKFNSSSTIVWKRINLKVMMISHE